MPYVRSQAAYADFIKGRDVDSALHREDGAAGYCLGIVRMLEIDDEEITQQQYETEKAAIEQYNAALPPPPPPSPVPVAMLTAGVAATTSHPISIIQTAVTILAKADVDITAAEVKTLVLLMARFLLRKILAGWR